MSKHAIVGLTKQVALDYAKDRIHCNAICPTLSHTAATFTVMEALKRDQVLPDFATNYPWGYGQIDDISGAAIFLASEEASFINGHCLVVDGGVSIS